jgi:hypothetical protein
MRSRLGADLEEKQRPADCKSSTVATPDSGEGNDTPDARAPLAHPETFAI